MKTLVARFIQTVRNGGRSKRKQGGQEEILIAKGREQFQKLAKKGLSIPIATL